ncbi:uncharacterized protein LOC143145074 isoform X1 [Ptiloglossa arizonensis]|uniref:uncharacterized protein LOC143145074 isoform X1 n=1 Tax=Ptiloglossa arizonensis TaxID=3350558 RepID=UPI003FA17124
MEYFKSFLCAIGLLAPTKVDVISELPLEVSQLILRKLDPESLLCAAQVSRKWLGVCASDKKLRRTARRHRRRTVSKRRREFLGEDVPRQTRMETRRQVRERKCVPSVVPCARLEAEVVFGRVPRYPPRYDKVPTAI